MKFLSTKVNKQDTTFEVELDSKVWKTSFANEKKNLAKNIQIQGFRKGHVPQAEIDKRISKTEVAMRTLERLQQKMIQEIIDSKEFKDSDCIDSVSRLEVVKLEPTPVIKVGFELLPKITNFSTKDIKNITIPPFKAPEVSEAMVKNQIRMMIRPDAMVAVKKDGVVAKGDIAVIDFKGFIDNKAFAGGEGKNYELEIGSKSFIDNFEDQLVGCKKGDKKDVNVTFPKDYGNKTYAGKPAKFEVAIKEVKTIEYPEITKDYCKKFAMDCANMKELEAHIKHLYVQEAEMRYQTAALKIINDVIGKKVKLDYYPKSLVQMHKNQIINQYTEEARRVGCKTLDQYKKRFGVDNAKFDELLDQQAHITLNVSLAYEKLIEDYDFKVTEADTKEYLKNLTRYVGDEKRAKELYEKNKDVAESTILRDKLFKKLIEEAKKEEPKKEEKPAAKKAK